jgi:hypothetical protein
MERRQLDVHKDSNGSARRRVHRVRILTVLHGLCLKIGELQQTEEARLACREVAGLLRRLRVRDGVKGPAEKS